LQIVIPMSGFGERFRKAGYELPKPLIQVENRPFIGHVTDLFVNSENFHFICNSDHLSTPQFKMREALRSLNVNYEIHEIQPHKRGPVHAVLSMAENLNQDQAVVVNYADFTCLWSFRQFLNDISFRKLDGSVPAYRGFHPHSGGSTNYAYIREEDDLLQEIREKQPFTDNKIQEFASTGTYYFKTAAMMREYFERLISEDISVNGEFYASSAFDLMAKDGLKVGVYEISHFMQWGTPEDLAEYNYWSDSLRILERMGSSACEILGTGDILVLASGLGSRFRSAGYETHKPALTISGRRIVDQVLRVGASDAKRVVSVTEDQRDWLPNLAADEVISFDRTSLGQADSARILLESRTTEIKTHFTVFPSDTLFADHSEKLSALCNDMKNQRFLVPWVSRPSPYSLRAPESFGWVIQESERVDSFIKMNPKDSRAKVLSGAFTFSSKEDFALLFVELEERDIKVNGEFYLDSMVEVAAELGFQVRTFEPEFCLSLGTPYEFETFRYWQTAFDQWDSHPYTLDSDLFVDSKHIDSVRAELRATKHLPSEWKSN